MDAETRQVLIDVIGEGLRTLRAIAETTSPETRKAIGLVVAPLTIAFAALLTDEEQKQLDGFAVTKIGQA